MFNGIIYNKGVIKDIRRSPRYVSGSLVIEVSSNIKFKKKDIGESVSCDGVCLTLIRIKRKSFLFYLTKETLKRSNFKYAKLGKIINIEKSLLSGQKISGHRRGNLSLFYLASSSYVMFDYRLDNQFLSWVCLVLPQIDNHRQHIEDLLA